MKQIKYNSGGQPFFNSDFALQQAEIYKAIEHQFADTNGLVLSGCVVTGNNISAGLVYLDGKIRELAGATGLTFPCYIKASPQIDYDSRVHTEDNQNKTTKSDFKAEITNTLPVSGDYITVTASGVDKRLQYVLKNEQTGQYTPDAFALNAGKVSYVEVSRTTHQTLAAGFNLVSWTSEIDELSEFEASSSEFVALRAGVYNFTFCARVDTTSSSGFGLDIQYWDGASWIMIANVTRNLSFIQGTMSVSTNKRLNAGEKVRFVVFAVGSGFGPLQYAYASVSRIA